MLFTAVAAQALTAEQAISISRGSGDERLAAIAGATAEADPSASAFLSALLAGHVRTAGDRVFVVEDGQAKDATTGIEATLPADAEDVTNNNRMRAAIEAALSALRLFSTDAAERQTAVAGLASTVVDGTQAPLVEKALVGESDPSLRRDLQALLDRMRLVDDDPAVRRRAADALGASDRSAVASALQERLAPDAEPDATVRAALARSLRQVRDRLAWGERLGALFAGLSLGSVLLLVALGLAITYGLMGVINMAHGELMMIGAYATYVVQNAFRAWWPGVFDMYLVVAIPAAFLASAAVGAVLERGVIRFLYGRPLETLLATWGISLVLMQGVRSIFGAQNVPVENPSWLSGGLNPIGDLTLPWNRIAIVAFAALVLGGVALVIARTRLGLFVRGVTQNRRMAACVGVDTARVDLLAFSLGAGIAGLAGCALSQVGNVGPDLGQSYIVDAFLVVVLGGVGQLAGSVIAALGLGVLNKLLEGWAGAVLAKIMVLVFIVVFIQKRPQGLFAMKGRSAEA